MVTAARTLADVSESDLLREIFPFFAASRRRWPSGPVTTPRSCAPARPPWRRPTRWSAGGTGSTSGRRAGRRGDQGAHPEPRRRRRHGRASRPRSWCRSWPTRDPAGLGGRLRPRARRTRGRSRASSSPAATCPRRPTGVLMVSVTALGDLERPRSRCCAAARAPAHVVAVNGTLGRSAAGLALLAGWRRPAGGRTAGIPRCVPGPPPAPDRAAGCRAGRRRDAGASAMIDLSDGLLRDGHRIAEASGVRLALVPGRARTTTSRRLSEVVGDAAWECVLAGGEEHSLLATFPGDVPDGWRTIGRGRGRRGRHPRRGVQQPRGWDHFRA